MADKPHPASGLAPTPGQSSPPGVDAKHVTGESAPGAASARGMGQRTSDARDAMAEMAERAQLISQEAGTKIAAAMKDVIGTAAGIAGFAVESARDLVQYMVRRGQITQDEADKLIRQAEDAHGRHTRSSAKAGIERAPVKPERPARESAREETKPAASVAKRASGATAASKPEKKQQVKHPTAKKSAPKPSAPKKKR